MPEDRRSIDEIKGDGTPSLITEPTLEEIKAEVDYIVAETRDLLIETRVDTNSTRFCRWDKQAPDGLKHAAYNSEEEPDPFEGASDMRVRIADLIINEDVWLLALSAMRAQISFKGTESSDAERAGKMTILMRWLIRRWGIKWPKELLKLANYFVSDSPAVALLKTYWRREVALKMETLTAEGLMKLYLEQVLAVLAETGAEAGAENPANQQAAAQAGIEAQARQAAEDFMTALASKEFGEEILSAKLVEYFPTLRPARAKQVIKSLRETGRAEFPVPYVRHDEPDISALRLNEDWFIPINTTDFQTARIYFEAEWLSKSEVIERQISQGWSESFVKKVIGRMGSDGRRAGGFEGVAAFPDYLRNDSGEVVARGAESYRGLYQILTAYYSATNEDGIPGKYFVVFHKEVDESAMERQIIGYAHGGYPGHVFQREVLTARLCDSRGIAELAGPYQGLMKIYCDSFGDHAQIAGVPPIITKNRQRMGPLHIKPLGELPAKRDGDFAWMKPPEYPRTVIDMVKELRRQMDEYFGRTNPEVAPDLVQLQREWKVLWWLFNLREALTQVYQLCQQYMTDEQIKRITNKNGEEIFKSVEEIQGQFDLDLQFDPRDLNPEYLQTVGTIVKDMLLAMDRDKTIQTAPIVRALLWRLSPELAEASLVNVDEANRAEIEQEIKE